MPRLQEKKRKRAEALILKLDPSFKQRWEIYDGILKRLTGQKTRWLDAGCGRNVAIEEFPCKLNVGMDIHRHSEVLHSPPNHFVMGSLEKLPFRDEAFTLVTLNTVVEHIRQPAAVFAEINRVLTPGGHVLIHTTNIHSPLVLLGRLFPESLRNRLFIGILGACKSDVFKAYHKLNTPGAFRKIDNFRVEEIHTVQDLNWTNRAVFICLVAYHLISRFPGLKRLRTNLIVLLRKKTIRTEQA